jgi:predicted TIM-barrel fold metal-dependent hydrolase
MRTITLEEHFATPTFLEGPGRKLKEQAEGFGGRGVAVLEQLCDLGDKRVAEMDAANIDVQVLSLTSPGLEQLDGAEAVALAREANESLANAVRNHPARFAGFASLPTAAPDAAAAELEHAIRDYGSKGR